MADNLKLKITAHVDERMFRAGDSIELKLIPGLVNYMVGPNGCGKSTLLHVIRAYKDSIHESLPSDRKSDFARGHDLLLYKGMFDVEGLDQFEHVFTLDAVEDNPVSFEKAATATSLLDGGGFWFMHHSRGEGSKMLISRFISGLQKITGVSIDKVTKKPVKVPETKSLIIIDEMDEGLDLSSQFTFHRLLNNLCAIFNATVLCVCHNPTCILFDILGETQMVFDMSDRSYKSIDKYISEQTDYHIVIMNPKEYNDYTTWIVNKNKTTPENQ